MRTTCRGLVCAVLSIALVGAGCSAPPIEDAAPAELPFRSEPTLIPAPTAMPPTAMPPGPTPSPSPTPLPTPTPASDPCELRDGLIESVATSFADRGPIWAGGDVTDVVALPDGRSLWIFGDTFYGDVDVSGALEPGYQFVNSSAVVQDGSCLDPVVPAGGASWIPSGVYGQWFWPQDALVVGDHLFVFLNEIKRAEGHTASLNFEVIGGGMAIFDLSNLAAPIAVTRDVPTTAHNHPFGWGAVTIDGFHYMSAHHHGVGTHVARVAVGQLANTDLWTFWNGAEWSADPATAAPVHPERIVMHQTTTGELIALAIPFDRRWVNEYTSTSPLGPFVEVGTIDLDPVWPAVDGWVYGPVLLPEPAANGRHVITYNFLPWDMAHLHANNRLYGPRLIESGL